MLEIIILCWLNFNSRTDGLEVWYTEEFMDISMTVSGPGPVAAKKKKKLNSSTLKHNCAGQFVGGVRADTLCLVFYQHGTVY